MSLGWTTESALSLKPGRAIAVNSSSLLSLRSLIAEREAGGYGEACQRRRGVRVVPETRRKKRQRLLDAQNPGVEMRAAKERPDSSSQKERRRLANMQRKSELYANIASGKASGSGEALVDFRKKRPAHTEPQLSGEELPSGARVPPPDSLDASLPHLPPGLPPCLPAGLPPGLPPGLPAGLPPGLSQSSSESSSYGRSHMSDDMRRAAERIAWERTAEAEIGAGASAGSLKQQKSDSTSGRGIVRQRHEQGLSKNEKCFIAEISAQTKAARGSNNDRSQAMSGREARLAAVEAKLRMHSGIDDLIASAEQEVQKNPALKDFVPKFSSVDPKLEPVDSRSSPAKSNALDPMEMLERGLV